MTRRLFPFLVAAVVGTIAVGVAVGVATIGPATAASPCQVVLTTPAMVTVPGGGGYDPFDPLEYPVATTLSLEQTQGEACTANLEILGRTTADRQGLHGPGTGSLAYRLDPDGGAPFTRESDGQLTLPVTLSGSGDRRDVRVWVTLLPGQVVAPGSYLALLDLTVRGRGASGGGVFDQGTASVGTTVPAKVELSLGGTDGGFDPAVLYKTVDFGDLQPGLRRTVSVQVRGTTHYTLSLLSDGQGALVADQGPGRVPYLARLDGAAIALSQTVEVLRTGPTPLQGTAHPLEFEILSIDQATAQRYTDTIHLTINPAL